MMPAAVLDKVGLHQDFHTLTIAMCESSHNIQFLQKLESEISQSAPVAVWECFDFNLSLLLKIALPLTIG